MKAIRPPEMCSIEALDAALRRFTYKPNFSFHVTQPAGWMGDLMLTIRMTVPDSRKRGSPPIDVQFTAAIPPTLSSGRFLEWLRGQIHRLEMHEADEWIRVDGKMIFDPHQ